MLRFSLLQTVLFSLVIAAPPIAMAWQPRTVWQHLEQLPRLDPNNTSALRSSYCLDGCRFDRHSHSAPKFLRTLGEEGVLFEDWGPGAITRIWMTMGSGISEPLDPSISIRIIIDGHLVTDMSLPDFFKGDTAPFLQPMNGDRDLSSGGNFSYTPMAYQQSCRVSLINARDKRIWFQIQHHRFLDKDQVVAFDGTQDFEQWRTTLANPGENPYGDTSTQLNAGQANLAQGASVDLLNLPGSDTLYAMKLQIPAAFWSFLHITISMDQGVQVSLPLADFFTMGRASTIKSLFLGFDGTQLYCYFPMPFFQSARITISDPENRLVFPISIPFQFQRAGHAAPSDSGYFTAVRQEALVQLGDAHTLFDVPGRGKWVGLFAELGSVGDPLLNYLEGDEQVFLNGSPVPQFYGTGVEDFFGGGFYFRDSANQPEPFQLALHGMVSHQEAMGESTTAMYRFMAHDAVSFADGAKAVLEAGPRANIAMRAKTIAYFYLAPSGSLTPESKTSTTRQKQSDLPAAGDSLTFTDPELEAYFLQEAWLDPQTGDPHPFDADRNGAISESEALAVTGSVDLGYRPITSFDDLTYFRNMTSLTITQSAAVNLAIHQLSQLERLSLRNNPYLETLSLRDLGGLKYLEVLDHPLLQMLTTDAGRALTTFVSDANPSLAHNFLDDFNSLQNLFIARTERDTVNLVNTLALRELSIEHAPNLTHLSLRDLPNLTTLELTACPSLETLQLENLPALQVIGGSQLPQLRETTINDLPQLEALRLQHLEQLQRLALGNLPQLTWLDVSFTALSQLELISCHALEGLHLAENQLAFLAPLDELNALEWLDLRGNQLHQLPPLPHQLTTLNVSGNRLRQLEGSMFTKHLVFAEFYENQILDIETLGKNANILAQAINYLGLAENFLSQDDCLTLRELWVRSLQSEAIFTFEPQRFPQAAWPEVTILDLIELLDQPFDCFAN